MPPVTISGEQFVRAGKPYEIISGELHYARIPREYWRDRLRKAKAMGLNTIQVYAFWNAHEPRPGVFDFTGNLDVAEFLREARDQNLNVLMRLGPYVCAEWDAGGFPSWLFEDPSNYKCARAIRNFSPPPEIISITLARETAALPAVEGRPDHRLPNRK